MAQSKEKKIHKRNRRKAPKIVRLTQRLAYLALIRVTIKDIHGNQKGQKLQTK